ncbi:MAG: hypothetical protein BWK77_01005 [Verrucomicrobia bacterium A1]|nr:MAG: hypothetical protein BWK77_01005 [Verrucomicrobia bacterium A1]
MRRRAIEAAECVSLICADTEAIRAAARAAYARKLREVEALDATIRKFQERDDPAFGAWVRTLFADEFSKMRALQNRIERLRASMLDAYELAEERDCPLESVWRDPDDPALSDVPPARAGRSGDGAPDMEDGPDGDDPGPGFGTWIDWPDLEGFEDQKSECAKLYRTLVRKLHPDHHGSMDEARTELWHRLQAAYRDRDLDGLEECRLACEGLEAGAPTVRVSLLRDLLLAATRQVSILRRTINRLKREIAWGFTDLANRDRLATRFRRDLERDRVTMTAELRALEMEADALREARSRRIRRRRTRRRAPASPIDFKQGELF